MSVSQPKIIQQYLDYLKQLPAGTPQWSFQEYCDHVMDSGALTLTVDEWLSLLIYRRTRFDHIRA